MCTIRMELYIRAFRVPIDFSYDMRISAIKLEFSLILIEMNSSFFKLQECGLDFSRNCMWMMKEIQ